MSGFRTHFRPFAGTAQSRKSALLRVLSVCGNWSTCFFYLSYGGQEGSHRLDLLSSARSVYDQGLNPVCRSLGRYLGRLSWSVSDQVVTDRLCLNRYFPLPNPETGSMIPCSAISFKSSEALDAFISSTRMTSDRPKIVWP